MWGKDWIQAKTQAECYDYLFGLAVEMRKLGMDASRPPGPAPLLGACVRALFGGGGGGGACMRV